MPQRQVFTYEFKRKAVELFQRGDRPASEVARELGIRRNQLYKWQTQIGGNGAREFPGTGRRIDRAEEVAHLKRELARVIEERDILRKAAAYFARESK